MRKKKVPGSCERKKKYQVHVREKKSTRLMCEKKKVPGSCERKIHKVDMRVDVRGVVPDEESYM